MPSLCLADTPLAVLTDELVRSVSASIWEASSGVDGDSDDNERRRKLLGAVQARLACTHPQLIVREITTKKRAAAGLPVTKRSKKLTHKWRPTRPKLALAAAQLLQADEDVVQAPDKQREGCLMPFKIFANQHDRPPARRARYDIRLLALQRGPRGHRGDRCYLR
jgi:hypothetical protein